MNVVVGEFLKGMLISQFVGDGKINGRELEENFFLQPNYFFGVHVCDCLQNTFCHLSLLPSEYLTSAFFCPSFCEPAKYCFALKFLVTEKNVSVSPRA